MPQANSRDCLSLRKAGTLSGLGSGDNSVKSSMESSKFDNWKLVKEEPLNSENKKILG
jgi:hypothetical protein